MTMPSSGSSSGMSSAPSEPSPDCSSSSTPRRPLDRLVGAARPPPRWRAVSAALSSADDARHPVVAALPHRDHLRVRVVAPPSAADQVGDELVGLVRVDRLDVPRRDLAVGVEQQLVVGERGVVQRDVGLPDLVVVDLALGGLDGGQVRAGRGDHALQRGVELRGLVGHETVPSDGHDRLDQQTVSLRGTGRAPARRTVVPRPAPARRCRGTARQKFRSAGSRSGEKPKQRMPSRANALASVPPESMYGTGRAPGSSARSAAAIASTSGAVERGLQRRLALHVLDLDVRPDAPRAAASQEQSRTGPGRVRQSMVALRPAGDDVVLVAGGQPGRVGGVADASRR